MSELLEVVALIMKMSSEIFKSQDTRLANIFEAGQELWGQDF